MVAGAVAEGVGLQVRQAAEHVDRGRVNGASGFRFGGSSKSGAGRRRDSIGPG